MTRGAAGEMVRSAMKSIMKNVANSVPFYLAFAGVLLMASVVTAAPEPLLPSCPSSPNCVSSLASDSHAIEPLRFTGETAAAFARLRDILGKRTDTRIIAADDARLQAEFRTVLGFVDDGLFALDAPNGVIQVRSAARVGYWDLGKNRRRMEEIRRQFSGDAAGR
jgi:uncharacterized protein (DUF1499 family)